jgi:hypothetical protein
MSNQINKHDQFDYDPYGESCGRASARRMLGQHGQGAIEHSLELADQYRARKGSFRNAVKVYADWCDANSCEIQTISTEHSGYFEESGWSLRGLGGDEIGNVDGLFTPSAGATGATAI